MLPLKDTVHARTFPLVNTMLIGINVFVFLMEVSMGPRAERLVFRLGVIPVAFLREGGYFEYATLITSMFLHGGWLHLFSNMLALYIFGDNVEDRMGPVRYLVFYLACGIAAGLVHIYFNQSSAIPTIGASGAIAGVLGAYLILFPFARVITLIPIFIFPWIVEIPALIYLGIWFLSQLLSGTAEIVSNTYEEQAGVAWWAHAGGFVAGTILVMLFAKPVVARRAPQRQPVYRRAFADEYYPW
jgi:membrane associated rhomboid family serine protease